MNDETPYKYLGPWRGSRYKQFFLKDRKVFAQTLYRETVGAEPLTPEEVAAEYDVPVEAVFEAIHYCTRNEELLRQERDEEAALIRERGLDKWPYAPRDFRPEHWR